MTRSTEKLRQRTITMVKNIPTLPLSHLGPETDDEPPGLHPEFKKRTQHELPLEGPVADFGRRRELPLLPDARSQVARFALRADDGAPAAWMVNELYVRGLLEELAVSMAGPTQADERLGDRGPLTDDDMKFVVRWLDRWLQFFPDRPIALDLSKNRLTTQRLHRLSDCLRGHPRVQALDLSRNRLLNGLQPPKRSALSPRKNKTLGRTVRATLTSPRGKRKKEPPRPGVAISGLLAPGHLRKFCMGGIPLEKEDRAAILDAVADCPLLRELDMPDCALSEGDVHRLIDMDRHRGWIGLGVGGKLTRHTMTTLAEFVATTQTLVSLNLETTDMFSVLDVSGLFGALAHNRSLEVLSLAGHRLEDGDLSKVTDGLRNNKCLRTLDLSRCAISAKFLAALVKALERGEASAPNMTLTQLSLPKHDASSAQHFPSQMCELGIERNLAAKKVRDRLKIEALCALVAGLSQTSGPWAANQMLPMLCKQVVERVGEGDLRSLAASVKARGIVPTVNNRARAWKPGF